MVLTTLAAMADLSFIIDRLPQNIITQSPYFRAAVIVLAWIIISRIVQLIVERVLLKIATKTKTDIDDKILKAIDKPVYFAVVMIGIAQGFHYLSWPNAMELSAYTLMIAGFGLAGIRVLNILLTSVIQKKIIEDESIPTTADDALIPLLTQIISVVSWILLVLFSLTIWGVQIGPFLAGLGIAGLAISFALQKSLQDVFGGIALTLDKNFKLGDIIQLDDGTAGKIQDIGLRSTKILNWNNETVIIPNGLLASSKFTNYKLPQNDVRGLIDFGVAYGSDPREVETLALRVANSHEKVLKTPEAFVRFQAMADFSLNFTLYFYVDNVDDRFIVKHELLNSLYEELNRKKINIPFPTRTIYMKKE